MDDLKLLLRLLDPQLKQEIAGYLSRHLIPCAERGCRHMATDLDDYSCFSCQKRYCLAEHMQLVNLVDLYSKQFVQALFYPKVAYMCELCIAYVAAESRLYEEDTEFFIHLKWMQQVNEVRGIKKLDIFDEIN